MPVACHEAVYAGLEALWNADVNKLGNGVTDAGVRAGDFVRRGTNRKRTDLPCIVVDLQDIHDGSMGYNGHDVIATLNIATNRDRGFAVQNAIEAGLMSVFHEAVMTVSGWVFGRITRIGGSIQRPGDDHALHLAIRFLIHAREA